jgi:patatin-related protein
MSTNLSIDATKPRVNFDQEVRFAVVMYGGSSLAIYINGVAQELLRLVRATAPEFGGAANEGHAHIADEELRGSERVYRLLGRILSRQGPSGNLDNADIYAANPGDIRTRFVVDILTGTSAGGINAVYLAKSLANDQNMDELKNLWVTEGDIGVLINDDESYKALRFKLADDTGEPWSLLNSRRMYFALLDALRGMDADKPACEEGKSPLVDELDLFVTATDMFGRPVQMRLADDVVSEYRHRNVFQFRYRSSHACDIDHSDFGAQYNAFLAFVARATSAHQAAFSPVRLGDVGPITKEYPQTYPAGDEHAAEHEKLRAFYRDYLLQRAQSATGYDAETDYEAMAKAFQTVWFVDGGTLDNKPFSFVVEQLPLRHAETFVDRKLLYIEPSPEQSDWKMAPDKRPQIVGNALAGLSSLPRHETIVEDLMRLLDRNRLVERLGHLMREMEGDLIAMSERPPREEFLKLIKNRDLLEKWLKAKGPSWGSYQRLRAAEVTDDLALLVTRAAGFSEDSEEFIAIRYLVRAWRANKYDSRMEDKKASIVEFLVEYDLMWTMRRIRFVLKKINELAGLDKDAQRIAGVPRRQKKSDVWPAEHDFEDFRKALGRLRVALNSAYVELRGQRRIIWAPHEMNPFRTVIGTLDVGSSDLLELMRLPTDDDRRKRAASLLSMSLREKSAAQLRNLLEEEVAMLRRESRDEEAAVLLQVLRKNSTADEQLSLTRADAVEELTRQVKTKLTHATNQARSKCSAAINPVAEEAAGAARLSRWDPFLRDTLWYYYINFEDFDQISYPLLYSTGVGEEADVIDVFRVSPQDASALIDECAQYDGRGQKTEKCAEGKKVKKLAGTTLGNFGAFFEKSFRINDIMWGRLDGAERVIAALLPAHPALRDRMTEEVHRAIIVEEMMSEDESARADTAMQSVIWQALDKWDDREGRAQLLKKAAGMLPGNSPFRSYLEALGKGFDPQQLFRERFLKNYDAARQFTQEATLKSAVRINRVLGGMAGGYLESVGKPSWKRRLTKWVGKHLLLFTEAAIQPDGETRRKQRVRLIKAYLLSVMVLAVICQPALVLLLLIAREPLPTLGLTAILVVTVPLAFIGLVLTAGYHIVWFKLRKKLDKLLPRARTN